MKIGIVGAGSIGSRHRTNAINLGHEAGYYDPLMRGDFRFEHQLYDWCDAAVIATPSQFHEAGLRACVERGKHVLVEKPISLAIGALHELLRIAADKNLVVMMGNNLRMHPSVLETKKWLNAGYIGAPIWASFACSQLNDKYTSDGVILNTGSHEVDLAMYLLGPALAVSASARKRDPTEYGGDFIADFTLEHENRVRSTFHIDSVTSIEIREFRIIGEDGDIYCDLPRRFLRRRMVDNKLPGVGHENSFNSIGSYDTDYLDEMRAFIDRIEGESVPGATGTDGLATLDLLLDVRSKAGVAPR